MYKTAFISDSNNLYCKCATGRYFQVIGNVHDLDSYFGMDNGLSLLSTIFASHWGHLAVIFLWLTANIFHIAWSGNYELWIQNPISSIPLSHSIWEPHFSRSINDAFSSGGSESAVVLSYSGLYNWLYTVGFKSVPQLYSLAISCELLALASLILGKIHLVYVEDLVEFLYKSEVEILFAHTHSQVEILFAHTHSLSKGALHLIAPIAYWPSRTILACFDAAGLRLNFHIGALFGVTSIAWCGHLIHVAICHNSSLGLSLYPLYSGNWCLYSQGINPILSFNACLKSDTASLYITDVAHHHLAIGVIFVWASHLYSSIFKAFGHRIRDVITVNGNPGRTIVSLSKSLHLNLALALAGLSVSSSVVAQHGYCLSPYAYLPYDSVQMVCIYVHHLWIASLLMIGSFSHAAIFLIRDYISEESSQDLISRLISHKASLISHLSWISLWLGFHTLGLYIHNDTVVAFGQPDKQIMIEPIFAQVIQGSSGKALYNIGCLDGQLTESLDSVLFPISPGDLLAHHAISLGLHVTTLILMKGSLDARGSHLVPDKIQLGFGFSCDGPGRGGTCDVSAWDSFYLGAFWMLNTTAWIIFYFHWKYLTLNTSFQFDESSPYLNGWFRDYLWFNSASLIRGYDPLGATDLSVWAWVFLAAHLCWATGFMFLISWRGYWQELVDIIIFMHVKTPILGELWNSSLYSPIALSIVQARFIGLVHFAVGFILTYSAFVIASSS